MRKLMLTGCGLVLILYLLPVFWPADQAEPRTAETVSAPVSYTHLDVYKSQMPQFHTVL